MDVQGDVYRDRVDVTARYTSLSRHAYTTGRLVGDCRDISFSVSDRSCLSRHIVDYRDRKKYRS